MILVLEPEKITQRVALGLGIVTLTFATGFAARYIRTLSSDLAASQTQVVRLETELKTGAETVKEAQTQLETARAQIKKANAEIISYQGELKQAQQDRIAIKKERANLAEHRNRLELEAEEYVRRTRQVAAEQTIAVRCWDTVSIGKNNELVKECVVPYTRK